MYFWKIQLLKKQLIEQGLSEKQLFYYILINVASDCFAIEFMSCFPPYQTPNAWNYVFAILNIAIPIIGTIFAFRANGGGSGVRFAEKYFSISIVIGIRFLVLLIPIMMALMIYWFMHDVQTDMENSPVVLLFSIWYAALYGYITKHIRQVAKA